MHPLPAMDHVGLGQRLPLCPCCTLSRPIAVIRPAQSVHARLARGPRHRVTSPSPSSTPSSLRRPTCSAWCSMASASRCCIPRSPTWWPACGAWRGRDLQHERHQRDASAKRGVVRRNLAAFRRLKGELGVRQPKVSLWFVAMRYNVEELPELVELAPEAGAEELYVQRLIYFGLGCQEYGWHVRQPRAGGEEDMATSISSWTSAGAAGAVPAATARRTLTELRCGTVALLRLSGDEQMHQGICVPH
jgi:hypothetical protein